jgi:hypothetical protein
MKTYKKINLNKKNNFFKKTLSKYKIKIEVTKFVKPL